MQAQSQVSKMNHKIRVLVTKNNVEKFNKCFNDHVEAKLALIKEMYRLVCKGSISNCGEYSKEYYQKIIESGELNSQLQYFGVDVPNPDNLASNEEYTYGKFNLGRVFPDIMNHMFFYTQQIYEQFNKEYVVQFIVVPTPTECVEIM